MSTAQHRDEIITLYAVSGWSMAKIGKRFGVSGARISQLFAEWGVETRTPKVKMEPKPPPKRPAPSSAKIAAALQATAHLPDTPDNQHIRAIFVANGGKHFPVCIAPDDDQRGRA